MEIKTDKGLFIGLIVEDKPKEQKPKEQTPKHDANKKPSK